MVVKGWCPGFYTPMEAKDGLLVRLSPPGRCLTSRQLAALADAASRFGQSVIQLTMRGSLQIRGLTSDSLPEFRRAMLDINLAQSCPEIEKSQAVVQFSPLSVIDPSCAAPTETLALNLIAELARRPLPPSLPAKFCFAIDGGGYLPSGSLRADIFAQSEGDAWCIRAGSESDRVETDRVIDAILKSAARHARVAPGTRLYHPRHEWTDLEMVKKLVGDLPSGWQGYGVPLGLLSGAQLRDIAAQAPKIHFLPGRAIMSPCTLDVRGLVSNPDDPRLRVFACVGAPGCRQGFSHAMDDARRLCASISPDTILHVSGCEKGCALPTKAHLTLVASEGGYKKVQDGTTKDAGDRRIHCLADIQSQLSAQSRTRAE